MKAKALLRKSICVFGSIFSAIMASAGEEIIVLEENFESDGAGTRYEVIAAGEDGNEAYWARRHRPHLHLLDRATDDIMVWGGKNIDDVPGPRGDTFEGEDLTVNEGRLKFHDLDIAGIGNLKIALAAMIGEFRFAPDDEFSIRVRFDEGDWQEIGGFKAATSRSRPIYYTGARGTVTTLDNPNKLFRYLTDWSWNIVGNGSILDVEITFSSNRSSKSLYFDNIRVTGETGLRFFNTTWEQASLVEPMAGEISNSLTITLEEPAPTGGITFKITGTPKSMASVKLPTMPLFIPEGESTLEIPASIIQDGQYTGEKILELSVTAPGYNPEIARVRVENSTPRQNVLITEVMNLVPGSNPDDLFGDANNNGVHEYGRERFVEIVNFDEHPVDLGGATLADGAAIRHLIPEGTFLYPNQALVVFDGGNPLGTFGGAQVQTASNGTLGLFQYSGIPTPPLEVTLRGKYDAIIDKVHVPLLGYQMQEATEHLPEDQPARNQRASVHRIEFTQTEPGFVLDEPYIHSLIEGSGYRLFSPGTFYDGTPYFHPENQITLAIDNPEFAEDAGRNAATGTITLAKPAPVGGLKISLDTDGVNLHENGTFSPIDIDLNSLEVTIPEGETSATFRIGAHRDGRLDLDRRVTITARSGLYVLPDFAEITIKNVEENDYKVVINEFLVDAERLGENFNGSYIHEDHVHDRYVELVNASGRPVNLSGWYLNWKSGDQYGEDHPMHWFPEGTWIADGAAIVIFDKILWHPGPTNYPGLKNSIIQSASLMDGALKSDGLDFDDILDDDGHPFSLQLFNNWDYLVFEHSKVDKRLANQFQSVTLAPDITGSLNLHLLAHLDAGGSQFVRGSPGAMLDGTLFASEENIKLLQTFSRVQQAYSGGWFYDPVFGWLAAGPPLDYDMPWVYSLKHNSFWYVHHASHGEGNFWVYDSGQKVWQFTTYNLYPWFWSQRTGSWILLEEQ